MKKSDHIRQLKAEIEKLKRENEKLRRGAVTGGSRTVKTPRSIQPIFDKAEKTVGKYFEGLKLSPAKGSIEISGERYILVRASALSLEFLNSISHFYRDRGKEEALNIGRNILFDLSHMLGMEDARNFHKKMGLHDPLSKLSAGPVHFAWSGWASVEILKESRPVPDEDYFIKYHHPYSFEADSWVKAGKKSRVPVCIMNSGYSSGWCEASFGMPLTSVEISCRARGDESCTFIMAPPHRIEKYLKQNSGRRETPDIPVPSFLERKKIEEKVKSSLVEKEVLLREIHHRVKNNLQIISSLLNLQAEHITDPNSREKYLESIGRIQSMAIIHELLYRSKNLSTIRIKDYLSELISYISQTYNTSAGIKVELKMNMSNDSIDLSKAIPCGIIINELLSNAFKYAFPGNKKGKITVGLSNISTGKHKCRLKVSDNGVGISKKTNLDDPDTLGLQLIHSLVEQLEGEMKITLKKGSCFVIDF
jgi:two-component sensor histidine kinase